MRQLLLNVDREMNELGLICSSTCLSVAKKKKIQQSRNTQYTSKSYYLKVLNSITIFSIKIAFPFHFILKPFL